MTDPLSRFYTSEVVLRYISSLVSDLRVDRMIDLGSGKGALTTAVLKTHPSCSFVDTYDLDPETISVQNSNHHYADVLHPDLKLSYMSYDLSISNPPYLLTQLSPHFDKILTDAGIALSTKSSKVPAEIIFTALTILTTKIDGICCLILPDHLITGVDQSNFRRSMISNHNLISVTELPSNSFYKTSAKAFLLLISPRASTSQVKLNALSKDGILSQPIWLSPELAHRRLDYSYHYAQRSFSEYTTLSEHCAQIRRGRLNHKKYDEMGIPAFHTSSFKLHTSNEIDLPIFSHEMKAIYAEPGDILMARIDRSLEEKIVIVRSGRMPISDAVYRIRVANPELLFPPLTSSNGRRMISAVSRGIGIRLLSKIELLNMPIPVKLHSHP